MSEIPNFPDEGPKLSEADKALARIYEDVGRTVDELAYTPEFDELYRKYMDAGFNLKPHEVFRRLLVLRKAGLLPRLFRSASSE